jgi:bifunctional non-homologous end joining protein LigD
MVCEAHPFTPWGQCCGEVGKPYDCNIDIRMPPGLKTICSIELMLATNHHAFSREGWIFELKWDGYRLLASKDQLLTRNKKDATTWYPEILAELRTIRGTFVLDGEVCLLDDQGMPNFETAAARARP